MLNQEEISRWEEIIKDRENISNNLIQALINHLHNFKDGTLSKMIDGDICPLKHSWKPSQNAIKAKEILDKTIVDLSNIVSGETV